ncbi:UDP-D-apiose/UDP-D-xylose synthase 2 [Ananas comosus]|uniref:UDP-D-apiose/UDP-D-xylose synthase 2 n=1 Tax=Ananas comosus TaxID=4615 RepID=A0A199VUT7_ANACO|nr:UDP-D-apiose/UDP-D-xylose synthase 2 [Ananas comosus]
MEHFGKTVRANQRCAEEVSAVLSGVGRRCHPPHLPPPGAPRRRLRKIKNLLGPPPEHRRIQFHRLNIKNDARLVGLIKTDKIKHLLEPPPEHGRIQFHRLDIKNDYRLEGHQDVGPDPIQISAYCLPSFPLTLCCGITMQVKYCSENNKRLIHFSTGEVYGNAIGSFPPKDHSLLQQRGFISPEVEHAFSILDAAISIVRGNRVSYNQTECSPADLDLPPREPATKAAFISNRDAPTVGLNMEKLTKNSEGYSRAKDFRHISAGSISSSKEKPEDFGDRGDGLGSYRQDKMTETALAATHIPSPSNSTRKVCGGKVAVNGLHEKSPYDGKHTTNIFYYLLVVESLETISMHSLWGRSQVINDLAKVWLDA